VSALRAALADKLGQRRFDVWFGSATSLELDAQGLVVGLPNAFFAEFVRTNFRRAIEEVCHAVLGRAAAVEFRVETRAEAPCDAAPSPNGNNAAATPGPCRSIRNGHEGASPLRRAPSAEAATATGNDRGGARAATATAPGRNGAGAVAPIASDVEPSAAGQVAYRRPAATFQSFVVGQCNRLAMTSARMIVDQPGKISPLTIHGPPGVGKTHLLEAIHAAARASWPRLATVFLSAEQFTSHFLEALRGSGLPSFRHKYRGVGLLLVDDLHFLAGKRATQVELLHTVDTILREGKQVVFAADRPPAELSEFGPELISRLQSGLVCPIAPPDYSTRLEIVARLARRHHLELPPDVQQFVASHLTSNARELSGAVCRLRATRETLGEPITLAVAEEALADLIRHSAPQVRLGDIEKAVCTVLGVEPSSLHSDANSKSVSHPRMLAMWRARKHTRAALSEISQYFGRRSHSTVVAAAKQVERWLAVGRTLEAPRRRWRIVDAVEQVERELRAG